MNESNSGSRDTVVQARTKETFKNRFKTETKRRGTSMSAAFEEFILNYIDAEDADKIQRDIEQKKEEIEQVEQEIQQKQAEKADLETELQTLEDNLEILRETDAEYQSAIEDVAEKCEAVGMSITDDNPAITDTADKHDVSVEQVISDVEEQTENNDTQTGDEKEFRR